MRRLGLLALFALSGCMRLGYDLLSETADGSGAFEGLSSSSSDPVSSSSRLDAGDATLWTDVPRVFDPQQVWQPAVDRHAALRAAGADAAAQPPSDPPDNPPPTGTPDAGGSIPVQACQLSGNEQIVNGFDGPSGGVQARGPGSPTLSWTGSEGNPDPGALEFQNSAGAGEVYYSGPLGDLRGRVMSLNVRVTLGTDVRFRLFVESGMLRQRASGPFVNASLGQWDCSQVVLDAPVSAENGFDSSDIVGAGLELEGSAPVRVYVDQIAY